MGYRRRKQPSQYRFLAELWPTFYAFIACFMLDKILDLPCVLNIIAKTQTACRVEVPAYLWLVILAPALYGIAASAYRFYRDFYLGEYWIDCESFL